MNIDCYSSRHNVGGMPDNRIGITQTEAKTVVALRCSFFTLVGHLSKIMQMLFGVDRIAELTGLPSSEYEAMGERLLILTEKFFHLKEDELDDLILEECECLECGHREFYLTTEVDVPKKCAKCNRQTAFLVAVPEGKMVEP